MTATRAAALLLAGVALAACTASGGDRRPATAPRPTATASPTASAAAGDYLALGDSVVFGYDPSVSPRDPAAFVGYPTFVARALGLALTNPSCPGETSGGFLSPTGTDNGCRPYRAAYHLHTAYTGTQMDFAVRFLRAHPATRLVTVMLGANDLFACARDTSDRCLGAGELSGTLDALRRNLSTVFDRLRAVYRGPLAAVTYYDPGAGGGLAEATGVRLLDGVVAGAARAADVRVADGYTAFARAAASARGDPCAAGLLARSRGGACDIHPSRLGAQRLAGAVVAAVRGQG